MMSKKMKVVLLAMLLPAALSARNAGETGGPWTLGQCIDYALKHNLQILKGVAAEQSAAVDVAEAKAGRLPGLSASVSQSVTYRPFQSVGGNYVNEGIATPSADKAMQSGSYGVNAQWVVWNGRKTQMSITRAEYSQQQAAYDTQTQANSVKEQIAQLYIQILYMLEAEQVNQVLLKQDSTICERGREMVKVGQMAKADLAQLEAQVSQGRYDVINVQTQIADAKMQLKQLLELPPAEPFEVSPVSVAEAQALSILPTKAEVYALALRTRPEVKRSELAIEQGKLNTRIARAGYYPTVSLIGAIGDSHITGGQEKFASQLKNNFNTQLGVSVSIPIFDNRANKSAVERAKVAEATAALDLADAQNQLYRTIETYWLNATNSQAKYVAARANVESLQASYELLTEQFSLGLKNIAELLTGRSGLLSARQQMLQDKYTALLNRNLLSFYAGEELK